MIRALGISFVFNLASTVLASLALIFVIAMISPATWGASAAILGAGQFLGSALSFGSQLGRIRRYSKLDSGEVAQEAKADSTARILLSVLLGAVAAVLAFAGQLQAAAVVTVAGGTFLSMGATNHLIGQRRYFAAGGLLMAEKTTVLAIVLTTSFIGALSELSLPMAIATAGFGIGAASLLLLKPQFTDFKRGLTLATITSIWRGSFYLGISSATPSLLLLDVALVALFAGQEEAGLFAVASKLTAPMSIAATAMVAVILPYLASTPDRSIPKLARRSIGILLVLLLIFAIVFAAAAWWVPLLFGAEYEGAIWPVRFYIANAAIVLGTRVFATVLQAWNDDQFVARAILAQVVLALAGISLGAQLAGALGASISLFLTNFLLLLVLLNRARKMADPVTK